MEHIAISVIVPIYNTKPYLAECIESILDQKINVPIEVLLIDDGSTDGCGEVCDKYAARDERVRVIHQENQGLSAARNAGIDAAKGRYYSFIDSDDVVLPRFLQTLYDACEEHDAYMSLCSVEDVQEDGKSCDPAYFTRPTQEGVFCGKDLLNEFYTPYGTVYTVAWNKMYRAEVWKLLHYPEGRLHEDDFVAHRLFWRCDKVVCIDKPLYHYRLRNGSICRTNIRPEAFDAVDGLADRYRFYVENHADRAVIDALVHLDFKPDVIHCHDWQTGLIPVHLKDKFHGGEFFRDIKSVMTIHNLKFQGVWDVKTIQHFSELPDYYFTPDKLEAYKDGNMLKGGIVYADAITTVSNTYAEEIKTPFYGEGLDGLMRARSNSLRGILNGIDYDEFNPETDKRIVQNYNAKTFRKEKSKNKKALQAELGLAQDEKKFMIGIVSRLTDQKGLDLVQCVMDEICTEDVQLVVLGTGDERYENMFRHYDWKYNDRVSANIYYSEDMSHKVYAACDAFLMPSLFEPCGLSQLMALRYGTVPIVRETGGLKDTVWPYNEYDGTGTGFSFANYNAHEMLDCIRYAKYIYYNKKREWNKIVDRGMAADFSWQTSAGKYQELYDWLIGY